jgi:hypothetical protein
MIDTEFAVSFDDYRAAHRLWLLNRPWPMFWHLFVMWILPIVVVAANCWSVWLWIWGQSNTLLVVYGVTIALTWLCLVLILKYRKGIRNRYQELYGRGSPPQRVRLLVDDVEVALWPPARAELRFPWSEVESLLEDEHGGVLVRGTMLLTVPRRVLTEEQWVELRRLAAAKRGTVAG